MIPENKSVMIWQLSSCTGRDMVRLADALLEMGVRQAWIKVADGEADTNTDLLDKAIQSLNDRLIDVWGWQYLYGATKTFANPLASQEADAAIRQINRYGLQGYILDPESYYKRKGAAAWADTYMTKLRSAFPKLAIGLCSYRYPTLHPELPWANFLRHCNFHAPQIYWVGSTNPDIQLQRSYNELRALANLPFVPVGAAYYESGWEPTVDQIDLFDATAHKMGLPGVSWWCWDDQGIESHPEFYTAIAAHNWQSPKPAPNPIPVGDLESRVTALEAWARTMGYKGPDSNAY